MQEIVEDKIIASFRKFNKKKKILVSTI